MSFPRVPRLGGAAAALLTVAGATCLLSLGAVAHADPSISVGPGIVYSATDVVLSGDKDPAGTVTVDVRPPGHDRLALTCTGAGVGSAAWSCVYPGSPDRPFGSYEARAIEVIGDASTATSIRFEVVPEAVGHAVPPPSPSPEPTTPTPEPSPEPTGGPAPGPEPPTAISTLIATPEPTNIELVTEALLTEDAPAQRPQASRPDGDPAPNPAANPSMLDDALPTIAELIKHPLTLAAAAGIGGLLLLLVAIPANILDSTIEANYERIQRTLNRLAPQLARLRTRLSRLPRLRVSAPLVVVLAAVAFGFTDPGFGLDLASFRLTLALTIGLVLVVLVPIAITRIAMRQRWQVGADVVARPGAFVLALVGVVASRTIGFSPGILIGLVLGLELARDARSDTRARATVIRIASTLVIAVAAWIGYSWLKTVFEGQPPTFGSQLMIESLAATSSEGLSGIMVAVLPITFMEGKHLFDASRRTWLLVAIPTAFAFALLVLPTVVTEEGPKSPIGLWVAVLVSFSLLVAIVWAIFRIVRSRDPQAEPELIDAAR